MTYTLDITRDWLRHESGAAHESFTARVDWVGSGEWQARFPMSHPGAVDMFLAVRAGDRVRRWGCFLTPQNDPAAEGHGFIARRVGLISGSIPGYEGAAGDSIVVSGWGDDAILNGALSYALPGQDSSTTGPATWAQYAAGPSWVSAEDALLQVIRDNLGPGALPRRRLAGFTVPGSSVRGGPLTLSRRTPTLLGWVREVCLASGLSLRVVRDGAGGVSVAVREQVTRLDVRWSRHMRSLAGVGLFYEDAPSSVLVGGQGEGVDRVYRRVDSTVPTQGFPFEVFKDDTGAATADELLTSGRERLAEETVEPSAVIEPRPSDDGPRLGVDYMPGDLTPVDAGSGPLTTSATLRVESVAIEHAQSGAWLLAPGLGQPVDDPYRVQERLFRDVRRAATR